MPVSFDFNSDKALAAMAFIALQGLPELTKGKLCKLAFLADRLHLVRYGRSITGDRIYAVEHGPILSESLNALNGLIQGRPTALTRKAGEYLELDRSFEPLFLAKGFDADELAETELEALKEVIAEYGDKTFAELRTLTHQLYAYKRVWNDPNRREERAEMRYEDLFGETEDSDVAVGALDEMLENDAIRKALSATSV